MGFPACSHLLWDLGAGTACLVGCANLSILLLFSGTSDQGRGRDAESWVMPAEGLGLTVLLCLCLSLLPPEPGLET